MTYERELGSVLRWLDETDRVALEHFAAPDVELKADGTPVTAADRAVEEHLRRQIERAFPGDAILGEEQGGSGEGSRRWVVDPIDGTKNYARGVPVWATLVALEVAGAPVLGVASAPALSARWWASAGGGAFRGGRPIRVSSVSSLADAHVCTGSMAYAEGPVHDGLHRLAGRVARMRGFGDFWGHVLVADGSMEAMVELAPLARWDVSAVRAIVEEAGGRSTTMEGAPAREGPTVTTNGLLHEDVLEVLRQ